MVKVLFVCMGNICRSPMAEAVFRHLVIEAGLADQFEIDSAGTLGFHAGSRPHPGTQKVLRERGVPLGDHCAREVLASDLDDYDYVLVMDRENLADLRALAPRSRKPQLFLDYAPHQPQREVPDPYYNGAFAATYDLVLAASRGLLNAICQAHGLTPTPARPT